MSFTSPIELATKLSAASAAITADWNAFEAATRIVPQSSKAAQPNHASSHGQQAGNADVGPRAIDMSGSPAVDRLTRAHDMEATSPRRGSLKERYDEFCGAKVKDHLRAIPQAIRSRRFDEMRSAIRRSAPQLRRSELDELAQRELESKIRAELHLPSIEEFAARPL